MSAGLDIKYVKELYENMPDDELIRIAITDAGGLTPEAMEVVKAEIRKRGLEKNNSSLSKSIDAQNKALAPEELDAYCDMTRSLTCPYCITSTKKLNGTMTGETMSFLVLTTYNRKIKIGCPDCLDKETDKALTKSALLGWWGIPWGIIKTIQSISVNLKSKKNNHNVEANEHLISFVLNNVGALEAYKDSKEKLQQLVLSQNRS